MVNPAYWCTHPSLLTPLCPQRQLGGHPNIVRLHAVEQIKGQGAETEVHTARPVNLPIGTVMHSNPRRDRETYGLSSD